LAIPRGVASYCKIDFLEDGSCMSLGDIRNLDYTILLCSKMQETKAFYLDVMGFPLAHDSENWVSFQVGSALLTLRPRGPWAAWHDGPIAAGSAALQLAFRVAPHLIDSCYATLQSKGVTILSPPRDIPCWHHRALFFRDPEGNVIELYAEV
jgi:glyoxylase I family protein